MISPQHSPLGLLTDLYQLTMAAGYWRSGLREREAVFLSAHHDGGEKWTRVLKLSEERVKISTPGIQQIRRFHRELIRRARGGQR
jgi:nicotinic acid phosphoribosyltransferase